MQLHLTAHNVQRQSKSSNQVVQNLAASSRLVDSRTTTGAGVITSPTTWPFVLLSNFWTSLKVYKIRYCKYYNQILNLNEVFWNFQTTLNIKQEHNPKVIQKTNAEKSDTELLRTFHVLSTSGKIAASVLPEPDCNHRS